MNTRNSFDPQLGRPAGLRGCTLCPQSGDITQHLLSSAARLLNMGQPDGFSPQGAGGPPPAGYPYPPQPQPGAAPGPYPYPPQQQQQQGPPAGHFAQAPAGYPAMPAGAPPGFADGSPPMKPDQMQQQYDPAAVGYIAPGPGSSHGGAPHHHQQQQHQGQQYAPAAGYPVGAGGASGGMAVVSGPGPQGQEKCACSIGWVLFGLGFLFTPCWLAAMLVPLCTRKRNDRLAGMASAVAFLIILVLAIALSVTQTRNRRVPMHHSTFNQWG
ncbi:hypothetical protein OEZ85_007428 [Tetradesmus obliquus]|uniref:Uncharacterized protein n=1 Tax=Tetradesmus obliquus TaxID=3088 RepID=A0ABY8TKB6_TETOB|nr:hypothetical protein OEZ85_007428 [Tetradesmus obliquus]